MVILVIISNRRLRSITNFFLVNLALADLCVGVFCIYQNFFVYIINSWALGEFLCKMYLFVQTLSSTASILILVGICIERYFAIIYPIISKRILTPERLKIKMLLIWIISIGYSCPRFIFGKTIINVFSSGNGNETICIMNREEYNSEISDMFHFSLLYCLPMMILTILYTRIALCLWRSSKQVKQQIHSSYNIANSKTEINQNNHVKLRMGSHHGNAEILTSQNINSSHNVLRARRGVIKMLIIIVVTFALCHLPYHLRKIWLYWASANQAQADLSALLTPLTYLTTYLNSAVNPVLYAFLSNNFRREMRSMVLCFSGRKKQSQNFHIRLERQKYSSRYTLRTNDSTLTGSNKENTRRDSLYSRRAS